MFHSLPRHRTEHITSNNNNKMRHLLLDSPSFLWVYWWDNYWVRVRSRLVISSVLAISLITILVSWLFVNEDYLLSWYLLLSLASKASIKQPSETPALHLWSLPTQERGQTFSYQFHSFPCRHRLSLSPYWQPTSTRALSTRPMQLKTFLSLLNEGLSLHTKWIIIWIKDIRRKWGIKDIRRKWGSGLT